MWFSWLNKPWQAPSTFYSFFWCLCLTTERVQGFTSLFSEKLLSYGPKPAGQSVLKLLCLNRSGGELSPAKGRSSVVSAAFCPGWRQSPARSRELHIHLSLQFCGNFWNIARQPEIIHGEVRRARDRVFAEQTFLSCNSNDTWKSVLTVTLHSVYFWI